MKPVVNSIMDPYHQLLERILREGRKRGDRTGVGTHSIFGPQLEFPVSFDAFPLLTSKKVHFHQIVSELYWMLTGQTNVSGLHAHGNHIWDAWAREDGGLGPVYGKQFRDFAGVDQLDEFVEGIRSNPTGRRHIMTLWNVPEIPEMALPPCHGLVIQAYVTEYDDGRPNEIDLKVYIRSWDVPVGGPYNIAQYALFLCLLCKSLGASPGNLIITVGDAHIYLNQVDQVKKLLERPHFAQPSLDLGDHVSDPQRYIFNWQPSEVTLSNYVSGPFMKFEVAV